MLPYRMRDFVKEYESALEIEVVVGGEALDREILIPEAQRVGLALLGYFQGHQKKRIMVFSPAEVAYLGNLGEAAKEAFEAICFDETPAIILSRSKRPPKVVIEVCKKMEMPLLIVPLRTNALFGKLYSILTPRFAPTTTRHGTFVEIFGIGVLIEGDPGVGKSEAALGLLERGHRLISDDVVKITREENFLRGKGDELTHHQMEIRGIGILDVAQLYGALCVRKCKRVDLVAHIEPWDDNHEYDRVGLEEVYCDILDISVPYYVVPVKPGRDVILLLETIALRHRLKEMGRCPAKAFSERLTKAISGEGWIN